MQLEYLAAIAQQTGEDWGDVDLVLSTAQPQLNAAPPELAALEVGVAARGGGNVMINGSLSLNASADENLKQMKSLRQQAQVFANSSNLFDAKRSSTRRPPFNSPRRSSMSSPTN